MPNGLAALKTHCVSPPISRTEKNGELKNYIYYQVSLAQKACLKQLEGVALDIKMKYVYGLIFSKAEPTFHEARAPWWP